MVKNFTEIQQPRAVYLTIDRQGKTCQHIDRWLAEQILHRFDLRTLIPLVHNGNARCLPRQNAYLLQCLFRGVTVIGVARHAAHAHDHAFLECRGDRPLHTELVGRSSFPLGDALDFWRMQGIQLAFLSLVFCVSTRPTRCSKSCAFA